MKTKQKSKYQRISEILTQEIQEGNFKKGERITTIPQICERFGVSNIVARRVLQELSKQGLVVNKPGYGAVIARSSNVNKLMMFAPPTFNSALESSPSTVFKLVSSIDGMCKQLGIEMIIVNSTEILMEEGQVVLFLYDFINDVSWMIDKSRCKLIFVHSPKKIKNFNTVRHGLFEGAYLITSHLISRGYKKIGYIGGLSFDWYIARFQGYLEALKQHGLGVNLEFVKETSGYEKEENHNAFKELFKMKDRPEAIFCSNDRRAIDILEYCEKEGIKVPGDIAIAGFDNIFESECTNPQLTTVDTKLDEVGKQSVHLAIKIMEGEVETPADVLVSPELVIREST